MGAEIHAGKSKTLQEIGVTSELAVEGGNIKPVGRIAGWAKAPVMERCDVRSRQDLPRCDPKGLAQVRKMGMRELILKM